MCRLSGGTMWRAALVHNHNIPFRHADLFAVPKQRASLAARQAANSAADDPAAAGMQVAALQEEIEQLRKEVEAAQQLAREADARAAATVATAAASASGIASDMVVACSGLSRLSLFSDTWHEANPTAAAHLFGLTTGARPKTTFTSSSF